MGRGCYATGRNIRPEDANTYEGWKVLIKATDCPPEAGRNDFKHRSGKNLAYFVIANWSEKCTIWDAPGSQKYEFYFDEEKTNLCKVIKGVEAILVGEFRILRTWEREVGWCSMKWKHMLQYHVYLIPKDADLKDAATSSYDDSKQRDV